MADPVVTSKSTAKCSRHPQHSLTQVVQGPVSWMFCGLCEAGKVRSFVDGMRDPEQKAVFERAMAGRLWHPERRLPPPDAEPGTMARRNAAQLLDEIMANGDNNGAVANAFGDDLRDATMLAADRLRAMQAARPRPGGPILTGARRLVAEVWAMVHEHQLNSRSLIADAALDLRDTIDTNWEPDRNAGAPFYGGTGG